MGMGGRGLKGYVAVQRGGWFQNPSELAVDHAPEQLVGHYVVSSRSNGRARVLAPA